jgi:ferritin-like metal-binding protein YciE
MTNEMYNLTTLHNLVDYDARKLASAETQVESILHDWITKAGALPLKTELLQYLAIVKQHTQRLVDFLNEENIQVLSRINPVMQAYIAEAREQLCNCMDAELVDASLLASVQGINHYKISMYGTAAAFSKSLGNSKAANLFHDALLNEKEVDERLSRLAEQEINARATAPVVLRGSE